MDRKTVLLMACREMLTKCRDSFVVISPMETTIFYDGVDCDGHCLLEDIEIELEEILRENKIQQMREEDETQY
jgi:hypothetical protein